MLIKILKLKYTLIPIIFAAVMVLSGLTSYAQDSDVREGKIVEAPPSIAPQVPVPQTETIQDFTVSADGKEPSRIADTFGRINVEEKIIQLEQKVNQLMYLNAILLLLIMVAAGSFGIVKMRKKLQ